MRRRRTGRIGRGKSKKEPKARFVLFCEGSNTEPAYFSAIRKVWIGALIEIETRPGVGSPITVAKEALGLARGMGLSSRSRRRKNSFEENDWVWAIFDRDDHERYSEAVAVCEENGIGVARSNPCFELWLILHETDYDRPDGRHVVQRELERLRKEYDRNRRKVPDCEEMVTRLLDAETRSEAQLRRRVDEGSPFGPPSTTVGALTREIREADERARQGR